MKVVLKDHTFPKVTMARAFSGDVLRSRSGELYLYLGREDDKTHVLWNLKTGVLYFKNDDPEEYEQLQAELTVLG